MEVIFISLVITLFVSKWALINLLIFNLIPALQEFLQLTIECSRINNIATINNQFSVHYLIRSTTDLMIISFPIKLDKAVLCRNYVHLLTLISDFQ